MSCLDFRYIDRYQGWPAIRRSRNVRLYVSARQKTNILAVEGPNSMDLISVIGNKRESRSLSTRCEQSNIRNLILEIDIAITAPWRSEQMTVQAHIFVPTYNNAMYSQMPPPVDIDQRTISGFECGDVGGSHTRPVHRDAVISIRPLLFRQRSRARFHHEVAAT